MFSLNVPVPGAVRELAWALRSSLVDFETLRDEHTLVVKRLPVDDPLQFPTVRERAERAIRGTPSFEVEVIGIDVFEEPPAGPAPVLFLAVDSPGLVTVHKRLLERFEPVPHIEGPGYRPHITLARGGDVDPKQIERLVDHPVEPITWTVTRLQFWDAKRDLVAGELALPQ